MAECCNHFKFTDDGDSFQSWQGLVGPYYIPHISTDGVLSWTNTGSLPNPAPVDISGPPGSSVELRGPVPSVEDLPATAPSGELWLVGSASPYDGWFYNGVSWENAGQIAVGPAGEDGVSPEVTIAQISGGHSVTITDADHPQGQQFDVMDGTDGQPGTPGADGVSPEVTIAQISGGHSVTITDADHPQGQTFNVLDGQTGQTGPAGPGVPSGGSTGQVLKKASATDYDTEWGNVGDVTADMLGIVIDGNSTEVGASAGQYVIVKNSTISGVTDGLYKAALAIPANTAIDATYLSSSTVDGGGLNDLQAYQADKYIQFCSAGSSAKTITLTFESTYPSFLAFGINSSVFIEAIQITSTGIQKQFVGTSTNDLNPTKISDSACSFSLKQWGALTIVCSKRFTILVT